MAALKAIVQWFPRRRIALINGWYLAFGGLGALSATAPFEFALTFTDWRGLFVLLAAGTLAAAALIYFAVPDKPPAGRAQSLREDLAGLAVIYRDPYFWRITPLMFTGASLQMAIQGLWAGPWLSDVEGLARASVANHLLALVGLRQLEEAGGGHSEEEIKIILSQARSAGLMSAEREDMLRKAMSLPTKTAACFYERSG